MKIYEYSDHRSFLKDCLKRDRNGLPELTYSRLADAAGVTGSFFSQVMKGSQDFNNDQLFSIGIFLDLNAEELDYLILLNEYHRCSLRERKTELAQEIENIQHQHLRVIEYMNFNYVDLKNSPYDDYLCDIWAPSLNGHLTLAENLANPKALQEKLKIPPEKFDRSLGVLEKAKIIEPATGGGYRRIGQENVMFYKLNVAAKFQAIHSRMKAVEKVLNEDPTDLITTIMFCANDAYVRQVKTRLLQFQQDHLIAYEAESPTDIYYVNIDLFPVEGDA